MKKTDLNLKKLLKITEKLTMEMTDLEYIEPNFYLCADEFAEYCPKMANNLIELDKLNLIEAAIYLYYSAANTADNLILNKEEFLKTFKKFDSNLSLILNDETVLKTILSKFNNVLQFINYISSVKNDFYEDDSCLLLIEASYLYLYLEIASSLDKYEEFSRYSFNPEDFVIVSEEEPVKKDDLVKLIVNYYTENPNLINDNILDFIVDFDNVVEEIIEKNNQLVPTKKTELKDESVKKETKEKDSPKPLFYKDLEKDLSSKIKGQDAALNQITNRLKTTEYGIKKKAGAKAVYMLLGPTGVGKTETVKALSQLLRTNQQLIRIDMGEYKEAHMASKILGSPPGYVGYDNNLNVLEIISKNPDSFILIDEIEKAHPSVVDLFLHMFDEGKAKSSHQKTVDLSNNVFFITSNIGAEEKAKNVIGFSKDSEPENKVYLKSLKKHFRPEFINRINETVIFNSLTYESVYDILNLQLREMEMAFLEEKDIKLNITLTNEAYLYLINGMDYSTYGAREIKRTIEKYILNGVIDYLINTNSKEVDLIFDIEETELLLKPIKKEIMKKQLTYNKI